jgi:hypothetical protein
MNRLLKTAHLRRPSLRLGAPLARALVAAYPVYALTQLRWVPRPGYPSKDGCAALHLGPFEQPGRNRGYQLPIRGMCWAGVGLLAVLLVAGHALATEVHGENSSFAGHGVLMAWGILKAPVEDQSRVVVRIVATDPALTHVRVDGVDPFTQERKEMVAVQPLGRALEVASPRGSFADFTRREFQFFTAADRAVGRPSLTIYFVGVPDTTPEFLAAEVLTRYLDQTVAALEKGGRRAP